MKVADCEETGGWETLFLDPTDGRYWERTYPQGEQHGGGPAALLLIRVADARKKYTSALWITSMRLQSQEMSRLWSKFSSKRGFQPYKLRKSLWRLHII
jgi:hypothetical protein